MQNEKEGDPYFVAIYALKSELTVLQVYSGFGKSTKKKREPKALPHLYFHCPNIFNEENVSSNHQELSFTRFLLEIPVVWNT